MHVIRFYKYRLFWIELDELAQVVKRYLLWQVRFSRLTPYICLLEQILIYKAYKSNYLKKKNFKQSYIIFGVILIIEVGIQFATVITEQMAWRNYGVTEKSVSGFPNLTGFLVHFV